MLALPCCCCCGGAVEVVVSGGVFVLFGCVAGRTGVEGRADTGVGVGDRHCVGPGSFLFGIGAGLGGEGVGCGGAVLLLLLLLEEIIFGVKVLPGNVCGVGAA